MEAPGGALEEALLAAPAVEATAPGPDQRFRESHQAALSPAHEADRIQRAIDQGRRHERTKAAQSRLSSLSDASSAGSALRDPPRRAATGLGRRVLACALAVLGAALQLLCWLAAYGFDLRELERAEFRRYTVGTSLADVAGLALFQLGWMLGAALGCCRVRSQGYGLAVAVLGLTAAAAVAKVVVMAVAPSAEGGAGSAASSSSAAPQWRATWAFATAALSAAVPCGEAAWLYALRREAQEAWRAAKRARSPAGHGYRREGRESGSAFGDAAADDVDVLEPDDDVEASIEVTEQRPSDASAEQQRWLRGASLRAAHGDRRDGSHRSSDRVRSRTDTDTSVEWGEPEAEAAAASAAVVEADGPGDRRRGRNRAGEGERRRQPEAPREATKRSERDKERRRKHRTEDGRPSKSGKSSKKSGKPSRSRRKGARAALEPEPTPAPAAAAVEAPGRDRGLSTSSAEDFLATPARKSSRSKRQAAKPATVGSEEGRASSRSKPASTRAVPAEYAVLCQAWAAAGMEAQ